MPSSATIRTALIASLTASTGITNWENIGFSMLPSDAPSGFLYRLEMTASKTTKEVVFAVGIGVASTTLSGLFVLTDELTDMIAENYGKQRVSCEGLGTIGLLDGIREELPDSYVNQNVTSSTEAFRTAITFALKITVGY
jgi:hypothetical protein